MRDLPRLDPLPTSPWIRAADLVATEPATRHWHVDALVPGRTVTLLSGDGGTGKSLIALQLAVATATGRAWIGRQVQHGPALFLSAEDDVDEIHRRLADIAQAEAIDPKELGPLTIRSLAGMDALLCRCQGNGTLTTTGLFREIEAHVAETTPVLLVLDTAADLFGGQENDRSQVRAFIGMLRGLAIRHRCAVVLLSHPSVSGMASGTGLSGSTAWNNSVRSRLYLDRVRDDGQELDPDARVLKSLKANYGRTGASIALRWQAGVFVAQEAGSGLDRKAAEAKADRVFLCLLDAFTAEGRTVKSAQAAGYAPKLFAASGRSEGLTKADLAAAMERLFARGEIVEVAAGAGPPSKQTKRIVRAEPKP
jgi:RecA-family ATPase